MFIQPDWFEVTKAGVGTNRYSYSFNDPVNLRDPSGNEMKPMPASQLWYEASRRQILGAPEKYWWGGNTFENAVLRSMGLPKNTSKHYSAERAVLSKNGWSNVIPDSKVVSEAVSRLGLEGVVITSGEKGFGLGFIEVKATSGTIGLKTGDYQLQGHIDALSNLPGSGTKELWLVTTSDAKIDPS